MFEYYIDAFGNKQKTLNAYIIYYRRPPVLIATINYKDNQIYGNVVLYSIYNNKQDDIFRTCNVDNSLIYESNNENNTDTYDNDNAYRIYPIYTTTYYSAPRWSNKPKFNACLTDELYEFVLRGVNNVFGWNAKLS